MRTPMAAGADGPANILAAVACAACSASRGRGVAVVMNNTIHEARWVRKANSMSVETFESPVVGPAGMVLEGVPQYFRPPSRRYSQRFSKPDLSVRVALVETCLGEAGEMLDAVANAGYRGIVIAAYGAGHVSDDEAQRIEALAPRLPIVISSRTGSGSTAARTYGFSGSEIDLARRGALFSGWLGPRNNVHCEPARPTCSGLRCKSQASGKPPAFSPSQPAPGPFPRKPSRNSTNAVTFAVRLSRSGYTA
jgi:L-asparaginase